MLMWKEREKKNRSTDRKWVAHRSRFVQTASGAWADYGYRDRCPHECTWGGGVQSESPINAFHRYAKHEIDAMIDTKEAKKKTKPQMERRRSSSFSRGRTKSVGKFHVASETISIG